MIVTTQILKKQLQDYKNILDKIKRDVDNRKLFRLNRGLYETDSKIEPFLLSGPILSPSYLSFEWALSYYGLIPERVVAITAASLGQRKNKCFTNYFGRFTYTDIPESAFSEGLTYINVNDRYAMIATKEKAICDSLAKWPKVNNLKELKELLFTDKRIDEDEFERCNFDLMLNLAKNYKKTNLMLLAKLIKRDYLK